MVLSWSLVNVGQTMEAVNLPCASLFVFFRRHTRGVPGRREDWHLARFRRRCAAQRRLRRRLFRMELWRPPQLATHYHPERKKKAPLQGIRKVSGLQFVCFCFSIAAGVFNSLCFF